MSKRAKEDETDPFLRVDGVATRFAIEQLRTAEIDPEPLLAKAGISGRRLAGPSKGISAKNQLRFLEIAAAALDRSDFGFRLRARGRSRGWRSLLRNGSVTRSEGGTAQPRPLFERRE